MFTILVFVLVACVVPEVVNCVVLPPVGDHNNDAVVDVTDLSFLLIHWGMDCAELLGGCSDSEAQVGISTLAILLSHWGQLETSQLFPTIVSEIVFEGTSTKEAVVYDRSSGEELGTGTFTETTVVFQLPVGMNGAVEAVTFPIQNNETLTPIIPTDHISEVISLFIARNMALALTQARRRRDAPGCDVIGIVPCCMTTCCATHDACFAEHGCTANSWGLTALLPASGIFSACVRCNLAVVACMNLQCVGATSGDIEKLCYDAQCDQYFTCPRVNGQCVCTCPSPCTTGVPTLAATTSPTVDPMPPPTSTPTIMVDPYAMMP